MGIEIICLFNYMGMKAKWAVTVIASILILGTLGITPNASAAHGTTFTITTPNGGDCNLIGIWNLNTLTCTLTSDVVGHIVIDSDSVTLDGNGHSVSRADNTGGIGIFIVLKDGITVKNVRIDGFLLGISSAGTGNTIADNIIMNSFSGITVGESNSQIIGNTVKNNVFGIIFFGGDGFMVTKNTVIDNQIGIRLQDSADGNTIEQNVVKNNIAGIEIFSSQFNVVRENTVSKNDSHGIQIARSPNNIVEENEIIKNGGFGIFEQLSFPNIYEDNHCSGNNSGGDQSSPIGLCSTDDDDEDDEDDEEDEDD